MLLSEMDYKIRELERRWHATGTKEDEAAWHRELQRQLKHEYDFIVHTRTWYGGGSSPPMLTDAFNSVNAAWKLLKTYSDIPYKFGIDLDPLFAGKANPDFIMSAINAADDNGRLILDGVEFNVESEPDGRYYISNNEQSARLIPRMESSTQLIDISSDSNPIIIWWNGFGMYSGHIVDGEAMDWIEAYNLDMSHHTGVGIDLND